MGWMAKTCEKPWVGLNTCQNLAGPRYFRVPAGERRKLPWAYVAYCFDWSAF